MPRKAHYCGLQGGMSAALAHGHRGRKAPNTTPDSIRAEVLCLARTTYSGVNHTHLSELLRERETGQLKVIAGGPVQMHPASASCNPHEIL